MLRPARIALAALCALVAVLAAAPAASAAFTCTTGTIYGLNQAGGALGQINTLTTDGTQIGTFGGQVPNGLAITAGGGRYAYGVQNGTANGGVPGSVYRYDSTTNTTETFPPPPGVVANGFVMGGYNPANGFVYYGSLGGGTLTLYAFDTATETSIGRVASVPVTGDNGDLAFDSLGNIYFAADTALYVVKGPIPSTAGNPSLPATQLTTLPVISNGIAFDGDGTLYIGANQTFRQVDPATGAELRTFSSFNSTDLASCATPNTIRVQKELPDGRAVAGDQFTLAVTGGGVTQGNTGTTAGTDSGRQDTGAETAGPVLGQVGSTFTITETPANGAVLGNYATTWRCLNTSDGDRVIADGSGPSGSFTLPATDGGTDVLCLFRNEPKTTGISLDKQAGALTDLDGNGPDAGDSIVYRFVVENTGNQPLDPVTVSDPKVGPVDCPSGPLAGGASITCGPVTYLVTQADINAGAVVNSATVTGRPPSGPDVTDDDTTTTPTPAAPAIELDKRAGEIVDANGNDVTDAGDTITFTFVVTNTGNVPLDPVRVTDPKVGTVTCTGGALAPRANRTCTAPPYALTQDDVDRGTITNTATATGTPPSGPDVTDTDDTTTAITAGPGIDLDKLAGTLTDTDRNGVASAGDTIAYTFRVTNTGNVTLNPFGVTDPKVGPVACPGGALAPDAVVTCGPVVYTVTQADVTAGEVVNTARATGQPPVGPPVTNDDTTTTPLPPAPSLELDKVAGTTVDVDGNGIDAGDTIAYRFAVRNTGNVPLDPVEVADPKVGTVTCPAGALDPGDSVECGPVVYALTQADVNAGSVVNVATATGTPPGGGTPVTDDDTTTTPVPAAPSVRLEKTAGALVDANNNGLEDADDTIEYRFRVFNTGNVTLNPITVTDTKVGSVRCPAGAVAPGDSRDCQPVVYTVTAADTTPPAPGVAPGVRNTATATGVPPQGPPVTDDDTVFSPVPSAPAIRLDKRAGGIVDANGSGALDAGDTLAYEFVVTNAGNQPLDPVTIADPKVGPVTCPAGALGIGDTITCGPVTYRLTQDDIVAGSVTNTATVRGTPPGGQPDVTDEDSTTTPTPAAPGIALDKRAGALSDVDGSGGVSAGDTIAYTFVVTNTGNVPLDPVRVRDPKVGTVDCPPDALAPGAEITCVAAAPYAVEQADINAGRVVNTATAIGTPPGGGEVTDTDTTTTLTPSAPAIRLDKQAGAVADVDGNGIDVGDTIAYTFEVRNTGNVALDPVTVADPKVGPVACPAGPLAPGTTVECGPVTYTLVQADLEAGAVDNTATATGTPPSGDPVTDEDTVRTPTPARPAIRLTKSAGPVTDGVITYTFVVRNVGNVALDPVRVADPKIGAGGVVCPAGALAPGAEITCDPVRYTVTTADRDAGSVVNVATATGTPASGGDVTDDDTVTTPVEGNPAPAPSPSPSPVPVASPSPSPAPVPPATLAVGLQKRAGELEDVDGNGPDAGDVIRYTFVVTNTGDGPLARVRVRDPKLGRVTCPQRGLAVGESMTCTARPYRITAAEALAGRVENSATVDAQGVDGDTVEDNGLAVSEFQSRAPRLVLRKRGPRAVDAGSTASYRIVLRNRGTGTARGVRVCDILPPGTTLVRADRGRFRDGRYCFTKLPRLAPGASRTWRITVRVDIDARRGRLVNRAVARARGESPERASVPTRVNRADLPTDDRPLVTG